MFTGALQEKRDVLATEYELLVQRRDEMNLRQESLVRYIERLNGVLKLEGLPQISLEPPPNC